MKGMNAVEVISDFSGDTYRCIFTTQFKNNIYVLHCFQKKSKTGIKTPKQDLDLIRKRLNDAKKQHEQNTEQVSHEAPDSDARRTRKR